MLGAPVNVHARTSNRQNRNETEDMAVLSLEFASGAFATSSVTLGSRQEMSRLRFCFSDLVAESGLSPYNPGHDPWTFPDDDPAAAARIAEALADFAPLPERFTGQFHRLHAALTGDAPLPVTLADARRSHRAPDRRLLVRRQRRARRAAAAARPPLLRRLDPRAVPRGHPWLTSSSAASSSASAPSRSSTASTCTIEDGEFVVFVGPSGCGKSTLLRMIAGLEPISDGALLIDGAPVHDVPAAKRGLAMVFQSYALYPHMSVRKNLSFGLETIGAPKAEIERKVKDAAEILQITELLERRPGQLSGGQRQRVAIGRAIVREPKIFLFDEPLSNLDAELRMQMRVEINRLHRRLGSTMVFVTHDQVEAMTLADRIVVLRKGVIEQVGTPLELYNQPANIFVAGFIGSPRMNLLPGRIGRVDGHRAEVDLDQGRMMTAAFPAPPKPGATITVGVRPESLVPAEPGAGILRGEVQLAEHLGGETYVYVALPTGQTVTVEIKGQADVSARHDAWTSRSRAAASTSSAPTKRCSATPDPGARA